MRTILFLFLILIGSTITMTGNNVDGLLRTLSRGLDGQPLDTADLVTLLKTAKIFPDKGVVDNNVRNVSSMARIPMTPPTSGETYIDNSVSPGPVRNYATMMQEQPVQSQPKDILDAVYKAFSHAETGSVDNPWIRTKAKGTFSSAFGPVQVTGGMLKTYLKKKKLFTKEQYDFIKRWNEESDKFLAHDKGEVDDPNYGYGGQGNIILSEDDKKLYEEVTKIFLADTVKRNKGNPKMMAREWHFGVGGKHDKSKKNPSYERKFLNALEPYIEQFKKAKKQSKEKK